MRHRKPPVTKAYISSATTLAIGRFLQLRLAVATGRPALPAAMPNPSARSREDEVKK